MTNNYLKTTVPVEIYVAGKRSVTYFVTYVKPSYVICNL